MKTLTVIVSCAYCHQPKDFAEGWHSCPPAQEAKRRLQTAISGIQADMLKPHQRRLTSIEMSDRKDRRHDIATSLKITNFEVKEEYR
jgi:hypothetical protein